MTASPTLAGQDRASEGSRPEPPRTEGDANIGGGVASRRDLIAMHNSLLKAIQGRQGQGQGKDIRADGAIAKLHTRLDDFGEALVRMESLLAVNMRAEIQKAVREVAGPEAMVRAARHPRRLSRFLLLSLLVNFLLVVGMVAWAVPYSAPWVEHEAVPRLLELFDLPTQLAKRLQ